MSCESLLERISAYVDGEVDPSDRCDVEAHLDTCSACSRAAEDFRVLDQAACREPVPRVRPDEWARVWQTVESGPGPVTVRRRFEVVLGSSRRVLLGLGAAAALVVGSIWLVRVATPDRAGAPEPAGESIDYADRTLLGPEDATLHLEGPAPKTSVDPESGTLHLQFDEEF